jgi:hypothetical protein
MEERAQYKTKLNSIKAKLSNGYVIIETKNKKGEKIEKLMPLNNNDVITLNLINPNIDNSQFIPVVSDTNAELIITKRHNSKNKTSTLFLLVDYASSIKEILRLQDYLKCEKEHNGVKSKVFIRKSIINSIEKKDDAVHKYKIITTLPNRYTVFVDKIEL